MMSARLFAIVDEPIEATALAALVAGPTSGAICTFEGTVRNHTGDQVTTHLEYEAFTGMAEAIFAQISAAASERSAITGMAIHHRVGRLEVGEVSVVIVVAAEHRDAAFEACRFAIDQLKMSAPIWKKEFSADGSHWVEGPTADRVQDAVKVDYPIVLKEPGS